MGRFSFALPFAWVQQFCFSRKGGADGFREVRGYSCV
jgi:hypothetical protein